MMKVAIPVFFVMCASVAVAMRASDRWVSDEPEVEPVVETRTGFRPEAPGPSAAVLKMSDDGHYWADAKIDGRRIRMMVDTGASMIALTRDDARRIGLQMGDLDFKWEVGTAGGKTYGAYVQLEDVTIGNVTVEQVDALVIQAELENSLLGMSFLSELSSFEFSKNAMIIRE